MENVISKLNNIAVDTYVSNPGKARAFAQEALKLAQENNSNDGIGQTHNTIGMFDLTEKNYDAAYNSFVKALDTYNLKGDKRGVAVSYLNIGIFNLSKNDSEKALSYFEKAKISFTNLGDSANLSNVHAQIANCYRQLGNIQEAAFNQRLSIAMLKVVDNSSGTQRELPPQFEEASDQILQDKVDKLQHELDLRNREIASFSIVLKQKNELLKDIRSEISNFLESAKPNLDFDKIKLLNDVLSKLRIQINTLGDNNWSNFKIQFERIHPDFFSSLVKNYEKLSQNELRHCAFLRMNMTNKEVASLLGIAIKSVEIARYRIKKKLGLDRSTKLYNFIANY